MEPVIPFEVKGRNARIKLLLLVPSLACCWFLMGWTIVIGQIYLAFRMLLERGDWRGLCFGIAESVAACDTIIADGVPV